MTKLINRPLAHLIVQDLDALIQVSVREHGKSIYFLVTSWQYQEWVWLMQRTHFDGDYHEGFKELTEDVLTYVHQQWSAQARGGRPEWNGRIQ